MGRIRAEWRAASVGGAEGALLSGRGGREPAACRVWRERRQGRKHERHMPERAWRAEGALSRLRAGLIWQRLFFGRLAFFERAGKRCRMAQVGTARSFKAAAIKKRPWKAGSRAFFRQRESRTSLFPKPSGISSFFTNPYRRYISSESGKPAGALFCRPVRPGLSEKRGKRTGMHGMAPVSREGGCAGRAAA